MTTPTIRGTSRADLLAMPAVLLGFHPRDSCAVMGVEGTRVQFCARVDLDWFVHHFEEVAAQVLRAAGHVNACRFVLIGYGDADLASIAVAELAGVVGSEAVLEALVCEGERYWSLLGDGPPSEYRFDHSVVAAQAVFEGIAISADRGSAVAPVTDHAPPAPALEAEVRREVDAWAPDAAMGRLQALVESEAPLTDAEAVTLALLLADEDAMVAVLARLSRARAEPMWHRLAHARRRAPAGSEANVLALLATASWLSGRGAAQSTCLEQLARLAPRHPVLSLLTRLHTAGLPPSAWDEP